MKKISNYITEKFRISKDTKGYSPGFSPQSYDALYKLLKKLIKKRGPDADLTDVDVSNITSFQSLFRQLHQDRVYVKNINISNWNTSKVKNMENMFLGCDTFNGDVSNWDVSNVESMKGIFSNCFAFEGKGLETWEPKNVNNLDWAFYRCRNLKADLNNWILKKDVEMNSTAFGDGVPEKSIPRWFK